MIQQNTPEWLEMRKNMIGASNAPVIMNVSPYTTPYQLWEQKLDLVPPQKDNWGMEEGRRKEDPARLELEKMTGFFFLPQVKMHSSIPWMMASLDCIDPEGKTIAEIKCPNKEDHQCALEGNIPEKYFPQIQHQLEVCQLEMSYYFSFYEAKGVIVKVYRDDKYIKKMIEKEQQFWECLQEFTPPELTEKDYERKDSDHEKLIAAEWDAINSQLKQLEKKEKEIRSKLIEISGSRNCLIGNVKVTRIIRKGNVDYSLIPELSNVKLENYRKNPIESYRISCV